MITAGDAHDGGDGANRGGGACPNDDEAAAVVGISIAASRRAPLSFATRLALAPMVGLSELPFRLLCRA